MLRVLIALFAALLLAALATALVGLEGRVLGEVFGMRFDAPSGVIVLTAVAALAVVAILTSLLKDILRWPAARRAKSVAAKGARGQGALEHAYALLAGGDARAAQKALAKAEKSAAERPLYGLLKAEAHAAAGEDDLAQPAYQALTETADFKSAALHGLLRLAQRSGDTAGVTRALEQAAAMDTPPRWAFDAALEQDLSRADWAAARARLASAPRKGRDAKAHGAKAEAMEKRRSGDRARAVALLEDAIRVDEDFVAAIVELARALAEAGDSAGARQRLDAAYARLADERLARMARRIEAASSAEGRPLAEESATDAPIDRARARIFAHDSSAALELLRAILDESADREASHLAAIAAAAGGGFGAAELFLESATLAPAQGPDLRTLAPAQWAELVQRALADEAPLNEIGPAASAEEARLVARRAFQRFDREMAARRGALALPAETSRQSDEESEAQRRDAELARAADAARGVS